MWNYMCIRWLMNWNDSTKNGRCYNKIYNSKGWPLHHSHRCHVIFIAIHLPTSSLSLTQHNCFLRLHLHCLLCWIHPLDEKFCWHFYILKYFFNLQSFLISSISNSHGALSQGLCFKYSIFLRSVLVFNIISYPINITKISTLNSKLNFLVPNFFFNFSTPCI